MSHLAGARCPQSCGAQVSRLPWRLEGHGCNGGVGQRSRRFVVLPASCSLANNCWLVPACLGISSVIGIAQS